MKIATIIVRVLMGLMFLFASITFLFHLFPQPPLSGNLKIFMDGIVASGYLMTLVKIIELICGALFLTGFFVPLATVVIFPIVVNIVCVHFFLDQKGLPIALAILAANLFLAYANRKHYKGLFEVK